MFSLFNGDNAHLSATIQSMVSGHVGHNTNDCSVSVCVRTYIALHHRYSARSAALCTEISLIMGFTPQQSANMNK